MINTVDTGSILLAQQGNPSAIALLMNLVLNPEGLHARVSRQDDCLLVFLEAGKVPNRYSLVEFVRRGLVQLQVSGIRQLEIYGHLMGHYTPIWQRTLMLHPYQPEAATSQAVPSQPAKPTIANPDRYFSVADYLPTQQMLLWLLGAAGATTSLLAMVLIPKAGWIGGAMGMLGSTAVLYTAGSSKGVYKGYCPHCGSNLTIADSATIIGCDACDRPIRVEAGKFYRIVPSVSEPERAAAT
ncbi:hypothetical protein ACQ4M4_27540 [Leptolyngbya sp. AN02str]|uniref:hypothetical protein n=1 Tax=Leptolyngbya sp. AN02str TaxID=3423363 RepID=UPI003D3202F4